MGWCGWIACVWASWIAGASGLALARWYRLVGHPRSQPEARRVLLVRPCRGDEAGLATRLATMAVTSPSMKVVIRLSVECEDDAARPAIEWAAEELRNAGWNADACVVGGAGCNRKSVQIAGLCADVESFDIVVSVDSDVDLHAFDLAGLLTPLADPRTGLAWAPVVEDGRVRSLGDLCSQAVLTASLHSFPVLGMLDAVGVTGKVLAVRREALLSVGGFAGLVDVLGEDVELARRLRKRGWRCAVAPVVARAHREARSVRDVLDRFTRWIVVVRTQRPSAMMGYPLLLAPLPWLAVLVAVEGSSLAIAVTAALVLASRSMVRVHVRRCAHLPPRLWRALPEMVLPDLVLTWAWFAARSTTVVKWRGKRFIPSRGRAIGGGGRVHHPTR